MLQMRKQRLTEAELPTKVTQLTMVQQQWTEGPDLRVQLRATFRTAMLSCLLAWGTADHHVQVRRPMKPAGDQSQLKGRAEIEIISWNNKADVSKCQGDEKTLKLDQQWRRAIMKLGGFLGNQVFLMLRCHVREKKNIENILKFPIPI